MRNILDSKPRVTRFKINWDDKPSTENNPPAQAYSDNEMQNENAFGSSIEDINMPSMEASNSSIKGGLCGNANMSNSNGPLTGIQLENNGQDSMDMRMFAD